MKKIFTSIFVLLLSASSIFCQVEDNQIYKAGEAPITIEILKDQYDCYYNVTGNFFFRYSEQEIDIKDCFSHHYQTEWYFNLPPIPLTEDGREDILYMNFRVESTCPEDSLGYIPGSRIVTDTPNHFYKTVVRSTDFQGYNPEIDSYRRIFDKTYVECYLDKSWRRTHKSHRDYHFTKLVAEDFSRLFVNNYGKIKCSLSTTTTPNNEYSQVAFKAIDCKDLDIRNPTVFVPNLKVVMRDLFDQINFHDHLTKYWISVHKTKTALGKKRPFIYLFKLEVK